jgi:hypothetical protein
MEEPSDQDSRPSRLGFNGVPLGAVILLMIAGILMVITFYVLPGEHLEIPEIQVGVRVTREAEFPVGASRLVRGGPRTSASCGGGHMLVVSRHPLCQHSAGRAARDGSQIG